MIEGVRAIHLERCRTCGKPATVDCDKRGYWNGCGTCNVMTEPQPSARASADKWNAWEVRKYVSEYYGRRWALRGRWRMVRGCFAQACSKLSPHGIMGCAWAKE